MTMRPEDIKNRTFANALRGYDKDEVRSFLFKVAESSRELHERLTETELATAAAGGAAEGDVVDDDVVNGIDPETSLGFGATTFEGAVASDPMPEAEAFVESPMTSLASAEQSISDRYGAIGDRIADLLRNADASANELLTSAENDSASVRAAAEAEAAQIRTDAQAQASQLLAEAQSIRAEADAYRDEVMAELATARLHQETALEEARIAAEADVETYRVDSIEEIKALRADAFVEIDDLRSGVNAEVADMRSAAELEADSLRSAAVAEATAAIADDQSEAARLREEAEADRAVARAELEDVRSEVSTLLEQARTQSEFIKQEADEIIRTKVRANFEQAQARIDVLRNTEVASRERILLAQTELAGALDRLDAEPLPALDPADSPAVIEEAERRHDELTTGGFGSQASSDADVIEAGIIDDSAPDASDVDPDEHVDGQALSSSFDSGDDRSTGEILGETFDPEGDLGSDASETADSGWVTTEVSEVENIGYGFDPTEGSQPQADDQGEASASGETDAFDVTEHVVVESAGYSDLPIRGEASSSAGTFAGSDPFGTTSLSEAVPTEPDAAAELGGVAQEDALARLVREAMQEAVDSARKQD